VGHPLEKRQLYTERATTHKKIQKHRIHKEENRYTKQQTDAKRILKKHEVE
jgi:hypothetical protein